jgi:hypothetical protein
MNSAQMHVDHIPSALKDRPQWVGFLVEGKKKTPVIADEPERNASSSNPRTWRPFSVAADAVQLGKFNALAYALNEDFIGIDLDHCLRNGTLNDDAAEMVQRCDSYSELSFSGDGVHILLAGTLPEGRGRRLQGVEIYNRTRFFITTGNRLPDSPATIQANPDALSFILERVTEKAERSRDMASVGSVVSDVSVTPSVDELVLMTMPKRSGDRNARLLDLARGLRFNCGMADRPLRELRDVVQQWHKCALPLIETKEFTETWSDFIHAWLRALVPLGDVLTAAWTESQTFTPPPAASDYDSEPVRRLVCFCAALARPFPDGRFFLSSHDAARFLKVHAMQVHRWLQMLIADTVLEVVHIGNTHRATRYRWKGGESNDINRTSQK